MPYLKGDLHISDRTLNLTSPDRKDIIKDDKLYNFKTLIKLYAEKLCNETILSYNEEEIDNYTSAIGYYINKKEIKNSLKFMTFKSNDDKDFKYLKGIAMAKTKNSNIENFRDYELYLQKEAKSQSESLFESIDVQAKVETQPEKAKGEVIHESSSSYSDGYVETPKIDTNELTEIRGEVIIDNSEPIFYIGFSDVAKYEYKLNVAKHYKLKIIVARNKVEESILKSMKESDNVLHISELDEVVLVNGNISNTTLSIKEQRAMMLFDMISRIFGLDHNAFAIGDLIVSKNIKVDSLNVNQDIIDDDIVVLKDTVAKKVYVDRSIINQNCLREDTEENLDINDYKFILANLQEIVKELSLLNCEDKNKYMTMILNALGNCKNNTSN